MMFGSLDPPGTTQAFKGTVSPSYIRLMARPDLEKTFHCATKYKNKLFVSRSMMRKNLNNKTRVNRHPLEVLAPTSCHAAHWNRPQCSLSSLNPCLTSRHRRTSTLWNGDGLRKFITGVGQVLWASTATLYHGM